MRPGEAIRLRFDTDVHLEPAMRAKFGYIAIREGGRKKAKRNLSLTARAAEMLKVRKAGSKSPWVFPGDSPDAQILVTSLDHMHDEVRTALKLPQEFVLYSCRHTMLTRLGEAGADAFTIMRIAGHKSVTTSQKYVHPTPEGMERAFERLEELNARKFEQAKLEGTDAAVGIGVGVLPTKLTTVRKVRTKRRLRNSLQIIGNTAV